MRNKGLKIYLENLELTGMQKETERKDAAKAIVDLTGLVVTGGQEIPVTDGIVEVVTHTPTV